MLAMKLKALASLGRGDKDMADARRLAAELGITERGDLAALYVSIHCEAPSEVGARRLATVLERG